VTSIPSAYTDHSSRRHLCWRGESVWRSGRHGSPDRARSQWGSARLSALPGNRRDPSGQRPTTAPATPASTVRSPGTPSQHGPATGTRIRDANTSAFPTTMMPGVRGAGLYVTPRTDLIHASQLRHRSTRCANTLPTVRSGHTVPHRVRVQRADCQNPNVNRSSFGV
jgi:hypothetical protein